MSASQMASNHHLSPLPRHLLEQHSARAARALLGHYLVREVPSGRIIVRITETEAYRQHERGSHAFKGITERTRPMFGPSGYAYVYLIYGMYWCFNIVTERNGYGAAVLLRGGKIIEGEHLVRTHISEWRHARAMKSLSHSSPIDLQGPGKLCVGLQITGSYTSSYLLEQGSLWIAEGAPTPRARTSPRIGIAYAGDDAQRLWRFSSLS